MVDDCVTETKRFIFNLQAYIKGREYREPATLEAILDDVRESFENSIRACSKRKKKR